MRSRGLTATAEINEINVKASAACLLSVLQLRALPASAACAQDVSIIAGELPAETVQSFGRKDELLNET